MLFTQNEKHQNEMEQLKDGFAQMLATQNEEHHNEMAQLKVWELGRHSLN
jgi:hypothetical protein